MNITSAVSEQLNSAELKNPLIGGEVNSEIVSKAQGEEPSFSA